MTKESVFSFMSVDVYINFNCMLICIISFFSPMIKEAFKMILSLQKTPNETGYYAASAYSLSSFLLVEGKDDLTWFAATMELTWLVQLAEMSGTSNSGYFGCLLWKGCLNGSLVTNSTWKLTSIYSHFLCKVLHSYLAPLLVSSVGVSHSRRLDLVFSKYELI